MYNANIGALSATNLLGSISISGNLGRQCPKMPNIDGLGWELGSSNKVVCVFHEQDCKKGWVGSSGKSFELIFAVSMIKNLWFLSWLRQSSHVTQFLI